MKRILLFSAFFVSSILFAETTSEYIAKDIETSYGVPASAWCVSGLWVDLKAGVCVITLEGNKDIQARVDKKAVMGIRNVTVSNIDAQAIYAAMHDAAVAAILADPQFTGGTLENVTIETPGN